MGKKIFLTALASGILLLGFFGSAALAGPKVKVTICHIPPGNTANAHTITIAEQAVGKHLEHGDTLGSCEVPPPPPLALDHFMCYIGDSTSPDVTVKLEDQFDVADGVVETAVVEFAEFFCNPVAKTHLGTTTPITNPDAHLEMYSLDTDTQTERTVTVDNQFGLQLLEDVSASYYLAVPTQKVSVQLGHPGEDGAHDGTPTGLGFPTGLDHFTCREVFGSHVDATVDLFDQFHQTGETVVVLDPDFLCSPVKKEHPLGVFTPITNPDGHLVCYSFNLQENSLATLTTHNQFFPPGGASDVVFIEEAALLCVPSSIQTGL